MDRLLHPSGHPRCELAEPRQVQARVVSFEVRGRASVQANGTMCTAPSSRSITAASTLLRTTRTRSPNHGWIRNEIVVEDEDVALDEPQYVQAHGSTLTLNVHVHMLVLDGLFVEDARGAPVWRRARRWRQADVDGLVVRVAAEHGSVRLDLKRPWSDGTTSRTFTALELVERLAALVPPPASNQVGRAGP